MRTDNEVCILRFIHFFKSVLLKKNVAVIIHFWIFFKVCWLGLDLTHFEKKNESALLLSKIERTFKTVFKVRIFFIKRCHTAFWFKFTIYYHLKVQLQHSMIDCHFTLPILYLSLYYFFTYVGSLKKIR